MTEELRPMEIEAWPVLARVVQLASVELETEATASGFALFSIYHTASRSIVLSTIVISICALLFFR